MGGSLATLVGMRLAEEDKQIAGIYTFGAPKLGKYDFQWSYNQILSRETFQFVNPKDPVTRLPSNLVSVGQTLELPANRAVQLDKDGAQVWDPLTALLVGQMAEHEMDTFNCMRYMDQLRKIAP